MSDHNIIARIEPLFRDLFDEYDGPVTAELDARSVEQWDSLANIQLVIMVEKAFGIRFSTQEIARLANLGELATLVAEKTGKSA
jgi:acyl carrier protein